MGNTELGSVTFESAGYCARYSAKKLVHGKDDEHDFNPISKKSSKHAIGKTWLEKFWPDVFNHGHLVLPNGHHLPSRGTMKNGSKKTTQMHGWNISPVLNKKKSLEHLNELLKKKKLPMLSTGKDLSKVPKRRANKRAKK